MSDCVHCAHEIRSLDAACTWCGRWQNGHMPMCETHATAPSIGLCVVCARPVCADCVRRSDGRLFCDDPSHQVLSRELALVATFDSEFDADWLSVVLGRSGILTSTFAFRDHAAAWWFPLSSGVRVFIPRSEVDAARSILADVDDLPHLL